MVGQEPILYARTINENISYGCSGISSDLIQHAAKMANAHGFIMDTQENYKTEVGEKGSQMSGKIKNS